MKETIKLYFFSKGISFQPNLSIKELKRVLYEIWFVIGAVTNHEAVYQLLIGFTAVVEEIGQTLGLQL